MLVDVSHPVNWYGHLKVIDTYKGVIHKLLI